MPSLGDRLNNALIKLFLLQEGGSVDYSADHVSQGKGGHGTHGERGKAPSGNSRPLVQQWADRFEALIERAEVDAGMHSAPERLQRKNMRAHLKQRMHEYEGVDPVDIAFYERCSTELVRAVRKDMRLNTATGERLATNERPFTAPARDALNRLQNMQNTIGGEL